MISIKEGDIFDDLDSFSDAVVTYCSQISKPFKVHKTNPKKKYLSAEVMKLIIVSLELLVLKELTLVIKFWYLTIKNTPVVIIINQKEEVPYYHQKLNKSFKIM